MEDEEIVVKFDNDEKVIFKEGWKLAIGQSSTVYRGLFTSSSAMEIESATAEVACAVKIAHSDEDSFLALEHERHVLSTLEGAYVMRLIAHRKGVSLFDLAPMTLVRAVEQAVKQLIAQSLEDSGRGLLEQKLLDWNKQLFQALCYLHERGVVHGDLKPHNVLLDPLGAIKLCDFGNSVVLCEEGKYPSGGTTAYTPPEALTSSSTTSLTVGSLEKRDVYAAGLTSYFIMTGRVPFKSHGSPVRLIVAIRQGFMECGDNGVPADLYSMNPQFYDKMIDFWKKCTHKQPDKRPTAHEALNLLSSLETIK